MNTPPELDWPAFPLPVSKATLKAIGNRVLLAPIQQDKIIGGIILPQGHDMAEEQPVAGFVLAFGERARCKCDSAACDALLPHIKIGDKVIFHRFDGTTISFQNRKYLVVEASNIIAKIE